MPPVGRGQPTGNSGEFPVKFRGVSENSDITRTKLPDRDLLIHAIQHLEYQSEQLARLESQVAELTQVLAVFRPLLQKMAPDGQVTVTGMLAARREVRRVWNG